MKITRERTNDLCDCLKNAILWLYKEDRYSVLSILKENNFDEKAMWLLLFAADDLERLQTSVYNTIHVRLHNDGLSESNISTALLRSSKFCKELVASLDKGGE